MSYFHIFLYIFLYKWLLKRNLATALPLKSKLLRKSQHFIAIDRSFKMLKNIWISKNFNCFKISPDKRSLRLWNKYFLTEIYKIYKTFAFQVLWKCSSWASRYGAVQMFFLTPTKNMFLGKFVKWVRFLAVLREYIFYNVLKELRFVKWVRLSEQNCIVKWEIFFPSFCWLWYFLPENLKLVDKLQIRGFESFILHFKIRFFGTALRRFSQWDFKISRCRPTMVGFFSAPPIKRLSTALYWQGW